MYNNSTRGEVVKNSNDDAAQNFRLGMDTFVEKYFTMIYEIDLYDRLEYKEKLDFTKQAYSDKYSIAKQMINDMPDSFRADILRIFKERLTKIKDKFSVEKGVQERNNDAQSEKITKITKKIEEIERTIGTNNIQEIFELIIRYKDEKIARF